MTDRARALFRELGRRKVFRVAVAYAAAGYVVIELAELIFPALLLPVWTYTLVVVLTILGFPIAVALAWAFDLSREGVRRTEPLMSSPSDAAAPVEPAAAHASIAVLPFVNMSAEQETEYFSDGMTEELIHSLAKIEALHVAARTSAFAFKGRNEDIRTIGQLLNVAHVLEGSVRKAGNRLRVTAQLIDVSDGYHLWSDTFDRDLEDVFAIQEEIARAIVGTLHVKLVGGEAPIVRRYTDDLEAYTLYLKGRYCWNKRTEEGLRSSVEYFSRAAAEDDGYALAHAGLADAYALLGIAEYGFMPPREVMPLAKAAARRALEIDDSLAEAQTQLAHVTAFYDWNWQRAETLFRRAIELNPGYAFAFHWYALLLAAMERHEEAIAAEKRARELEPLSLIINKNVGTILYYAGMFDEALQEYRKALELEPNFARTHFYLGLEHAARSRHTEAIEHLERAISLDPGNTVMLAALGYSYGRAGRRAEAEGALRELENRRNGGYVPALNFAMVHCGLGQADAAFGWLDEAHAERSSWLVSLKVEPMFDPLREDRRFEALVRRIEQA